MATEKEFKQAVDNIENIEEKNKIEIVDDVRLYFNKNNIQYDNFDYNIIKNKSEAIE